VSGSNLVDIFPLSLFAMFNPSLPAAITLMLLLPNPKRMMAIRCAELRRCAGEPPRRSTGLPDPARNALTTTVRPRRLPLAGASAIQRDGVRQLTSR
jgi:hypothetical protein